MEMYHFGLSQVGLFFISQYCQEPIMVIGSWYSVNVS